MGVAGPGGARRGRGGLLLLRVVRGDEAGFVGEDDGLDSVADAEFHQDAGDVGFDCGVSNYQFGSDLFDQAAGDAGGE
jgi:hypothetical protein